MKKKQFLTIVCIIYIIILFIGATVIKTTTVSKAPGFDKVLHFVGFLILMILLLFTFEYYKIKSKYLTSFLIVLGLGIIIEVIQLGIPGREFSYLDIVADLGGAMAGSILVGFFSKRK